MVLIMRLGIVPVTDHRSGGIYQYSLTMLRALRTVAADHDVTIFLEQPADLSAELSEGWRVVPLYLARQSRLHGLKTAVIARLPGVLDAYLRIRLLRKQGLFFKAHLDDPISRPDIAAIFKAHQIDLVIYAAPIHTLSKREYLT